MAYFINEKELDIKTIKELFSHELRFYEEFEEVIIYLTNLNSDLFDDFVQFDPFIFKRHPLLNEKQQEKLLISMLFKLKNEKSMAWGRWSDFEGTTLVKFDKLKLSTLIQKTIKPSDVNKLVFAYLIALLEYNYSKEMEDLIFTYLENYSNDNLGNKNLIELIQDNFIDEFKFNKRLYSFLQDKKLINSNTDIIYLKDFQTLLFESLYGIKYINRYGSDKKAHLVDTGFEFDKLLELLDSIPARQLEYIVPYLKSIDTLKWLDYIQSKQEEENYDIYCWCIYAVLIHNNSKDSIKRVFEFLITNFCNMYNHEFDEMSLDFQRIADNFWEVYFSSEIKIFCYLDGLLKFLKISLEDIKKAVLKYPIENYVKHYERLKFNEDIDKYLMQNNIFETYIISSNKYWEEQRKINAEKLQKKLLENEEYQQRIQSEAENKKYVKKV